MKAKIEIETKKSFYRIYSGKWRKYHLWRYYKRREAQGACWLIWCIRFWFFDIACYALHNQETKCSI